MATQLFSNNATSVLTVGINTTMTTLQLDNAASFPSPTGGDFFKLALVGLNTNGQEASWEVMQCTAKAGNALTVVRGQEGTTAISWGVGTKVELRLTAEFANSSAAHIANVSNPHNVTLAQLGAQDALVSGTNIKTVNGSSVLGSGDLTITSGMTLAQVHAIALSF